MNNIWYTDCDGFVFYSEIFLFFFSFQIYRLEVLQNSLKLQLL